MSKHNVAAEKRALRSELRIRRSRFVETLPAHFQFLMFRTAPSPLQDLLAAAPVIAAYVPLGTEPDLLSQLLQPYLPSGRVALPYFQDRDSPMQFRRWDPATEMEIGPFGMAQPAAERAVTIPHLLLMPLLGFDRSLNRIGQGGGHYDRFCAINPSIPRIGVAWSVQEVEAIPNEDTDIPLDAVFTQKEWIEKT